MTEQPLEQVAILVDPGDDVAVARVPVNPGALLSHRGRVLRVLRPVRPKHKLALRDLPEGSPVRLYGEPVGIAARAIAAGEPLEAGSLRAETPPAERVALASRGRWTPPRVAADRTFLGIRRADGGVGTRNHLLLAYTVPCARAVTEKVAAACRLAYGYDQGDAFARYARSKLGASPDGDGAGLGSGRAFPGVDAIVTLHHEGGCGMPDRGDIDALLRWIAGYLRNPNCGGAVAFGLGCEKTTIDRFETEHLSLIREQTGKPILSLSHQSVGAESDFVTQGIDLAHEALARMDAVSREPVPLERLTLGTKCGGSDGFSGLSANPALGWVSDALVGAGGTVLLPEVPEMFGGEHLLAERAVSQEVGRQVLDLIDRYREYAGRVRVRLAENPSVGNVEDGLLTIQMKSLGAIRKAGTGPVAGVLEYAEPPPGPGLYLLDTPGYDVISNSALPASGATLGCFTTGLGTPFGNPIMPTLKVSTNPALARRMPDVIDFDAGGVIEGTETLEECGARLLDKLIAVASGELTHGERNDHRESAFWQRQCNL